MSYDLAVFEVSAAPEERVAFMEWFKRQTRWAEPRDYNDPLGAALGLRAWFAEMSQEFPAMNGPHRWTGDWDNRKVSDYTIGTSLIYVAFAGSQGERAYEETLRLARKHGVGFMT